MREAGYTTGLVGKWMCGYPPDLLPIAHDDLIDDPEIAAALASNYEKVCAWIREHFGFDHTASIYRSNLAGLGLPRCLQVHNMEWITQGALEFIEENAERPFCLYMATTLPHTPRDSIYKNPLIVPTGLLDEAPSVQPSRDDVLERVERAGLPESAAEYTWLDDAVGAVLAKLDELDLADDTVVFYAPDHATRGKYTCYEGANVPLFVRWPGHIEPGLRSDELVSNIDLLPTFLELAGAAPLEGMHADGESFVPLLDGSHDREAGPWRESLLLEIAYTKAVVTDRWKYLALRYPPELQAEVDAGERKDFAQDGGSKFRRARQSFPAYFDYDQLYDLEADPLEQVNLAQDPDHAAVLTDLKRRLAEHLVSFPSSFGEFHQVGNAAEARAPGKARRAGRRASPPPARGVPAARPVAVEHVGRLPSPAASRAASPAASRAASPVASPAGRWVARWVGPILCGHEHAPRRRRPLPRPRPPDPGSTRETCSDRRAGGAARHRRGPAAPPRRLLAPRRSALARGLPDPRGARSRARGRPAPDPRRSAASSKRCCSRSWACATRCWASAGARR